MFLFLNWHKIDKHFCIETLLLNKWMVLLLETLLRSNQMDVFTVIINIVLTLSVCLCIHVTICLSRGGTNSINLSNLLFTNIVEIFKETFHSFVLRVVVWSICYQRWYFGSIVSWVIFWLSYCQFKDDILLRLLSKVTLVVCDRWNFG